MCDNRSNGNTFLVVRSRGYKNQHSSAPLPLSRKHLTNWSRRKKIVNWFRPRNEAVPRSSDYYYRVIYLSTVISGDVNDYSKRWCWCISRLCSFYFAWTFPPCSTFIEDHWKGFAKKKKLSRIELFFIFFLLFLPFFFNYFTITISQASTLFRTIKKGVKRTSCIFYGLSNDPRVFV